LGWRSAFVLAGILSTAGVVIAWAALPPADPQLAKVPRPVLDIRPVLGNRDALVLIFGYAAAIWGSAGLRQWIVVFLAFCAADQAGVSPQAWIMLAVGALISFLGVPAGLLGNELSIRYGLRNIATLVFLLSAFAGGLFGFTAMLPYIAVLSLAVVAGFIVQGNFSNLTSGVLAVAAPRHRGATIGPVRRHARSIRRHVAARRLDTQLRHLWARLFTAWSGFGWGLCSAPITASSSPVESDSPLEGERFEPSVPPERNYAFRDPRLMGLPFRHRGRLFR
jgi:MFS transporter